jgi:peptide/nickel transport system substrate-binding protein
MDLSLFDKLRRNASPVELELIESYAQNKISRRAFVQRGSVIGLSAAFMGSVIAACGSSKGATTVTTGGATATSVNGAATTVAGDTTPSTTAASNIKQGGTLRIAAQKPAAKLDPVAMADLGTYAPVVQCFEYLCMGLGGTLSPMRAESWKPNSDGTVWTFSLRKGVKWHDGKPFTSADVVATLDRLAGSNLKSYISAGSSKAVDDSTVEVTLSHADGQFPWQLSPYNPQSVITPADYVLGTTLDAKPNGTGAFKLTKYEAGVSAEYEANADYWGGKPYLDKLQFLFSEDLATQVSGLQGGAADAIIQFSVVGGDAILADKNLTVGIIRGAAHRQIWMNVREGEFTDKRVRQAIALGLDRQALIDTVLKGKGDLANDHPIAPIYPFFDATLPQRKKDVAKAKQLLADAGKTNFAPTMYVPNLQEIPQLAQIVQSQLKEIGVNVTLQQEKEVDGEEWCKVYDSKTEPAGCDGGKDFGIVDYGPRGVPDVYLVKAYATGEWNSAHYISEPFRAAVKAYQASLDLDGQKKAIADIQKIANDDVPYAIPYFYNSLFAYSNKVTGIVATGLGHFYCGKAGFTA